MEDARPYLVMEYVQGRTVDVYCDQQHLSIDERLRLFLQLCAAVQYAHQHLIIIAT
jgi:eukaryotic-like serine/threonine-protein kinase